VGLYDTDTVQVQRADLDHVDVAAGVQLAVRFGYGSPEHRMVTEYALMRHARGEEEGAQRSALSGGIDLTSWYAILAAALASAQSYDLAMHLVGEHADGMAVARPRAENDGQHEHEHDGPCTIRNHPRDWLGYSADKVEEVLEELEAEPC
jgi:hypothetical protein